MVKSGAPALRFESVSKHFGQVEALRDIHLEIAPGEIVAILGCNGAGKSTFINLASGLKTPTQGRVEVFGLEAMAPLSNQCRTTLPQELSFPTHLKVREILQTVYAHFPNSDWTHLAETLEVEPLLDRLTSELSGGERRKLALICALAGDPGLVLLDEPTANIDLIGQTLVRQILLGHFKGQKRSLVFSSHQMREVEELADRVVVFKEGRIVADTTVRNVKDQLGLKKVRFVPSQSEHAIERLGTNSDDLLKEILRQDPGARAIEIAESTLEESILRIWQSGPTV